MAASDRADADVEDDRRPCVTEPLAPRPSSAPRVAGSTAMNSAMTTLDLVSWWRATDHAEADQ